MMKQLLMNLSLALVSTVSINAYAESECQLVEDTSAEQQYVVSSKIGENLGYIAREEDGRWFAWINDKGAINETFQTAEEAEHIVCSSVK